MLQISFEFFRFLKYLNLLVEHPYTKMLYNLLRSFSFQSLGLQYIPAALMQSQARSYPIPF